MTWSHSTSPHAEDVFYRELIAKATFEKSFVKSLTYEFATQAFTVVINEDELIKYLRDTAEVFIPYDSYCSLYRKLCRFVISKHFLNTPVNKDSLARHCSSLTKEKYNEQFSSFME